MRFFLNFLSDNYGRKQIDEPVGFAEVDFNIWSPIALIRPNNKNYGKYIYYQLQSDDVNKQISLLTNTSSQGNIGMGSPIP